MISCIKTQCRSIKLCNKLLHMSANLNDKRRMSKVTINTINGFEDRQNDVLTIAERDVSDLNQAVVYFGGDVQNLEEEMIKHRDNKRYSDWSLEKTALLLAQVLQSYVTIQSIILYYSGLSR